MTAKTTTTDFDFSHLDKEDQKDEAKPFLMHELRDEPTIFFRPATDVNSDYWNEVMRRVNSGEADRQLRSARKASKAAKVGKAKVGEERRKQQIREDDAAAFAKFCATGWEDVLNKKGEAVEFSTEACEAYLTRLPGFVWKRLCAWITQPLNFQPELAEKSQGRETGKSSPPA